MPGALCGPVSAQEGCFLAATRRDHITLPNYFSVEFAGDHAGKVEFITPGTTAQMVVSPSPHWGILLKGPALVNGKLCKFVMMDHYVDAIRFLGHDDSDALLAGSGLPSNRRMMGAEAVVKPESIKVIFESLKIFFKADGTLKPFDMSKEVHPSDEEMRLAQAMITCPTWETAGPPADRQPASEMFSAYEQVTTFNCKRFALFVGQVFGLSLPDMVQAYSIRRLQSSFSTRSSSAGTDCAVVGVVSGGANCAAVAGARPGGRMVVAAPPPQIYVTGQSDANIVPLAAASMHAAAVQGRQMDMVAHLAIGGQTHLLQPRR